MRTADISDDWLKDMPQQFHGKHNIEVLIKVFANQLQKLQEVFDDMDTKLDIDLATGKNLDYVGTIANLSRKEAGELAGINVTDPVISDDRYRQFLHYKLLKNANECTYYDLMGGISTLWNLEKVRYIEDKDYPATIIFQMDKISVDEDDFVEFYSKLCIRASGVGILLRKTYADVIDAEVTVEVPHLYMTMEMYRKPVLKLNGSWYLDGTYDLSGYYDAGVTDYIQCDIRTTADLKVDSKVDAGVTVEKELWHLDGLIHLNGSRKLAADIYEINL